MILYFSALENGRLLMMKADHPLAAQQPRSPKAGAPLETSAPGSIGTFSINQSVFLQVKHEQNYFHIHILI